MVEYGCDEGELSVITRGRDRAQNEYLDARGKRILDLD